MKMSNLDKLGLEPDPIDGRHPFSEKELAKFEKAFKHKLPHDYVEFLKLHNGDWPKYEPTFRDGEFEVQSFFYLRPDGEIEVDDPKVGEWGKPQGRPNHALHLTGIPLFHRRCTWHTRLS